METETNLLFEHLQSSDYHIRQEAIWTLQKHPERQKLSSEQLATLYRLIKDPGYWNVIGDVIFLLSLIDSENALETITQQALDNSWLGVRLGAIEALARIGNEKTLVVLGTLDRRRNEFPHPFQEAVIKAINAIEGRLGNPNYR